MPDHVPTFVLAAHPGTVELTLCADDRTAIATLPARLARSLARNLEFYAEKAERLTADPQADIGPREGTVPAGGADHG